MKKRFLAALLAVMLLMSCAVTAHAESVYTPGTYTGVGQGRNGDITVEVTVTENEITDISVVSHSESAVISDNAFANIPVDILKYQTVSVDSVSGATLSSAGIKTAVANALTEAGADSSVIYKQVELDPVVVEDPVDAEICIVGGGVAGLTAAIRALELGEKVVLFEQSGVLGGSCAVASGQICGAGTQMQTDAGIEDDADTFYENIVEMYGSEDLPYPELTRAFVDKSGEMIDWLDEYVGVDFGTRIPTLGLYVAPNRERIFWTQGGFNIVSPMIEKLYAAVDAGEATLYMNTMVDTILLDDNGAACGVSVTDPNGEERTYDFEAVILACGGYCHNEELLKEYNFVNVGSGAPSTSIGSNIMFAEQVNAQLALIDNKGAYPGAVPTTGFDVRYKVNYTYPGSIAVNSDGVRFANETTSAVIAGYSLNADNVVWIVFNEAMRDEETNILSGTWYNEDPLSAAESWELLDSYAEAGNCVYKADTLEELAEMMGVDPETFVNTVNTYNSYAEAGEDKDFGRETMTALSEGPYYAVYSIPYVIQTPGGILIDSTAAVQNTDGETIPGLYAAGEAVGMNLAVPPSHGGKSIGAGTVWGMLAAESAVSAVEG